MQGPGTAMQTSPTRQCSWTVPHQAEDDGRSQASVPLLALLYQCSVFAPLHTMVEPLCVPSHEVAN